MAIVDDFFASVFAASRVEHVSDLHLKVALRPHHVGKFNVNYTSFNKIWRLVSVIWKFQKFNAKTPVSNV